MKLRILLLMLILISITSGCSFNFDLPETEIPQTSSILDTNGQVVSAIFEENRISVPIEDVSPYFLKAIIGTEDHRFFQHIGVDLQAITRAAIRNIQARATVEGGSTITQQTAKVLFLTPERTYSRKLKELLLTFQLERQFTKREILEKYVNLIYFGHNAYGIETAANTYFDKSAKELTLGESALLAGMVRGPAFYSPFTRPEDARARQSVVLNRMVELEIITKEEASIARNEEFNLASERKRFRQAPYFTSMVIEEVTGLFEDGTELLHRGGLTIQTTLDLSMQQAAENAFQNGIKNFDMQIDGALIAIDPRNGHIKALVGGRDFSKSQRNRAVLAKRQPGSAFKPFLYTAALERGFTAGSSILWEPVNIEVHGAEPWQPAEFNDKEFPGQNFTLKEALARSSNIIAAKLIEEIGPEAVADYGNRLGIISDLKKENEGGPFLSLALGTSEVTPMEITSAYGVFAANGIRTDPIFITQILDREGRTIYQSRSQSEVVLDERIAYIITDMLQAVITTPMGTASNINNIIQRPVAGKTGTTNFLRDAWFIGYTPELVAGVYIGDDENKLSIEATGGSIAAPIWARFMATALQDVPPSDFAKPLGVVSVEICSDSGLLATPQSPSVIEAIFIEGTEPTEPCPDHSIQTPQVPERQRDNWFNRFFNW